VIGSAGMSGMGATGTKTGDQLGKGFNFNIQGTTGKYL